MYKTFETEIAGRKVTIETGKLAGQSNGSVLIRCGDTVLLVCVTASDEPREGIDFFPLSVEFQEKLYAVGKIPGGFIKREGKPSEKAILTSRLIDRPIRPLFPKGYRNDVQVVVTVMSVDTDIPPDVYAMIGSSAALSISDIPFYGPTGSVVVGYVDGQFILNPDGKQEKKSLLHLTVSGTKDAIMMVEAGAKEVSEQVMLDAIMYAHQEIKKIVEFQEKIVAEVGKPKADVTLYKIDPAVNEKVTEFANDKVAWALETFDKQERDKRMKQATEETFEHFADEFADITNINQQIPDVIHDITKKIVRSKIINQELRPDGRGYTDIRPIWCEVGLLPRAHGSGVFTRGLTQVMTVATLGAMGDAQVLDGLGDEENKRYMHHYNMPPYSTGEAKPLRGPGRREIGHGALAERALDPVIPSEDDFPYAIRLVSEVLSSNGSTSQASVCGSTLALMDAGVPIKAPVAGVAMGLIKDEESGKIVVLTDIQGLEDFMGDMDFKVAGTEKGITAIQMDIKIKGIDKPILERALAQAKVGRMFILNKMLETIDKPRNELSAYAPKITKFNINPEKIRDVIGPGGKMINKIIAETGVKIDIQEDGQVFVSTPDADASRKARRIIEGIAKDIEVGDIYTGKVARIMPFGAFVEILPGKDGLVHISQLAREHVNKVEDVVNIGDEVTVKVIEIDRQGRINLSRKELLPPEEKKKPDQESANKLINHNEEA